MNKIAYLRKFISNNFFFKNMLIADMKIKKSCIVENYEKNVRKSDFICSNLNIRKENEIKNHSFSFFFNSEFLIDKKFLNKKKEEVLCFWNRSPGARYPKKANNGARPDCRSVRKIRKRLKTGK
ncbi:conserved Plasmodium protein, unknown function [Plasmodium gallinaceum]|uniref:Uncharacterized protein n=1 Tax=Plasmodium gallinaceum TaxID=5849 RepID=A0A1J1GX79_PLAGA|nr:conserved Plasmodium protein, unknown function [Plasmodium gallinaceum]CRG95624.1 conserved Plasmodium protein, unknown function [Plasmodium gallinaceum]